MEPTLPGFNKYCRELMCLAQGHNMVTPVGIEPRTSRSGVRHSTTTPPRSLDPFSLMLRLHWTTFSLRPYHVLKIQERGEDGVKMKQFRISKFPLRPYYVPATFLLRPHHVLTTSFTFPLRPQYALTKFIPFPLRPCYVLTKTNQFIPRANYVSGTF